MTNLPPPPPPEPGFPPPPPEGGAPQGQNVPQQGYAAPGYGGYPPQGYGPVPPQYAGQPSYAQPADPRKPSAFGLAWKALWFNQWRAWSGKPLEVADDSNAVGARTGNYWIFWVTTLVLNSLLMGLVVVAVMVSGSSYLLGGAFSSDLSQLFYYGPDAGEVIRGFFLAFLLAIAGYTVRGLGLWWSLRVAGRDTSFNETMTLYASGKSLLWFPLAIFVFLTLVRLMGAIPVGSLWVALFTIGLIAFNQLVLYLLSFNKARETTSETSSFTWYLIFGAGALMSYAASGVVMSILSLIFFV